MGVGIVRITLRIYLRGRGLKIAVVLALTIASLLPTSGGILPVPLLIFMVFPYTLSVVLVDQRELENFFYVLKIVGSTPRDQTFVGVINGLLNAAILASPYAILRNASIISANFLIAFFTTYGVINLLEKIVSRKISAPGQTTLKVISS